MEYQTKHLFVEFKGIGWTQTGPRVYGPSSDPGCRRKARGTGAHFIPVKPPTCGCRRNSSCIESTTNGLTRYLNGGVCEIRVARRRRRPVLSRAGGGTPAGLWCTREWRWRRAEQTNERCTYYNSLLQKDNVTETITHTHTHIHKHTHTRTRK